MVAAICAAIGGLMCRSDEKASSQFTSPIQIVLDRTSNMQAPFDGVTRLEAAKTAIGHRLRDLSENVELAIHLYGGADSTETGVALASTNAAAMATLVDTLTPRGEGSLLEALQTALRDVPQDRPGTVILIAGRVDSGDFKPPSPDSFRTRMAETGFDTSAAVDLRLIGIGMDEESRVRLEEMAAGLPHSYLFFADNTDELIRAVGPRAAADSLQQAKQAYYRGKAFYARGEFDKARPLLMHAAQQNIAAATHYLGTIYFYGRGATSVDYEKAVYWYRKGAALNNAIAMFNLGVMFDPDVRLETLSDLDSAKYWYGNAEALGHEGAEQRLGELDR